MGWRGGGKRSGIYFLRIFYRRICYFSVFISGFIVRGKEIMNFMVMVFDFRKDIKRGSIRMKVVMRIVLDRVYNRKRDRVVFRG